MAKIHGLIFDLDGTVTLTQQYHAQAFGEVFKNHGLTFTSQDDARFSGKGSRKTFDEYFKEHGITLTPEQINQYTQERMLVYDNILKNAKITTVPGVQAFLEREKQKGRKIAMATGNRRDATETILKQAGLFEYFSIIVTSADVKEPKPAPDIYLKAAELIGLKPDECIVFEDAVNGVTAAKNAGMACIGVKTTTPPEKLLIAGAFELIDSYDEVNLDLHK